MSDSKSESSIAIADAAPGAASETVAGHRAAIIDGKTVAAKIREELVARVKALVDAHGQAPGLAVVLVGTREDSAVYVRMKERAAAEAGIVSKTVKLPADAAEADVIAAVRELNADPTVHGILVQLPLPDHITETRVLDEIDPTKDVDGLHPLNVGSLVLRGRTPMFTPCTPQGCIRLLQESGVQIAGKHAVVLGRSNIVGLPVAMLLQQADATVTICHSRTTDLPAVVRTADILVAAIGRPNYVQGDWLKPGCIVIDVGVNQIDDATKKSGKRLVGDVDFDQAVKVAGAITPVPGGVGPMTIAQLMVNTVQSGERFIGRK